MREAAVAAGLPQIGHFDAAAKGGLPVLVQLVGILSCGALPSIRHQGCKTRVLAKWFEFGSGGQREVGRWVQPVVDGLTLILGDLLVAASVVSWTILPGPRTSGFVTVALFPRGTKCGRA